MHEGILIKLRKIIKQCQNQSGFTLIELLVVIVILGILAVIVIPRIANSSDAAKTQACITNMDLIESAEERVYFEKASYEIDVSKLVPDYLKREPICEFGEDYDVDSDDGTVNRADHIDSATNKHKK